MGTDRRTVDFILESLGRGPAFEARAMFGEYALYAQGKVVALVCDDRLYVKILPASAALAAVCGKDSPYPGAKPHYVVDEGDLAEGDRVADILIAIARALPEKKPKPGKKPTRAKTARPKRG